MLQVRFCGDPAASLRILIVGGQHGDERYARKAVTWFRNNLSDEVSANIATIATLNPDGAKVRQRLNALDIDLNRDHIRLQAAETRALHGFVSTWRPHVIIDNHNYPSRRRHLLERGFLRASDVCADIPTHPALAEAFGHLKLNDLICAIGNRLQPLGRCCDRYTLLRPSGRARHSTRDVVDARNGLALRYGAFCILLEGRTPHREENQMEREALVEAHAQAIRAATGWASNQPRAAWQPRFSSQGLAAQYRSVRSRVPFLAPLRKEGEVGLTLVPFPRYAAEVRVRAYVRPPSAYAVPQHLADVCRLLRAHGCASDAADTNTSYRVERLLIDDKGVQVAVSRVLLSGYDLFAATPDNSAFLALLLEPTSQIGLHRYADLGLTPRPGHYFKVFRVV